MHVWDLEAQAMVELRPWMQYNPNTVTRYVTPEQWEESLRQSLTESEYALVLQGRQRQQK